MFNRVADLAKRTREAKTQITNIDLQSAMIHVVMLKLRLWSLLVLPLAGYLIGQFLQYIFHTKVSSRYESLLVHAVTMIFMIATFNEVLFTTGQEAVVDIKERTVFVCISYLFVLGVVLGVVV